MISESVLTRRLTDPRDVDADDILMDGQTGSKKLPKDHTQVDIPMDGFDLVGKSPAGRLPSLLCAALQPSPQDPLAAPS